MSPEQKLAKIAKIVDDHFISDPYHAGKVAHQMYIDSAVNKMFRIRDVLREY